MKGIPQQMPAAAVCSQGQCYQWSRRSSWLMVTLAPTPSEVLMISPSIGMILAISWPLHSLLSLPTLSLPLPSQHIMPWILLTSTISNPILRPCGPIFPHSFPLCIEPNPSNSLQSSIYWVHHIFTAFHSHLFTCHPDLAWNPWSTFHLFFWFIHEFKYVCVGEAFINFAALM